MNFLKLSKLALAIALVIGAAACNEKSDKATTNASTDAGKMNVRYVDLDSIENNYNLAKDFKEAMLRSQNQLDAATKQRENEIQKFGVAMEQKYKNNGYPNQESFNADQAKLQKMQVDAQNYLAGLQQNMANEMQQSNAQLLDSINNFMKDYAKLKGYDVILNKAAALYIDEKYDVTKDVIEGLNKRYVKVKKDK